MSEPRKQPYSLEWSIEYFQTCERDYGSRLLPCHRAGIALLKALRAAEGQPRSDGVPSVLSEEGVEAAYRAFCSDWPYELSPRVRPSLFAALQAYLAAERGVSAVPPTEEPNEPGN